MAGTFFESFKVCAKIFIENIQDTNFWKMNRFQHEYIRYDFESRKCWSPFKKPPPSQKIVLFIKIIYRLWNKITPTHHYTD